jgi:hypothetical protein
LRQADCPIIHDYRHCRLFYNQKLMLVVCVDLGTFALPEHMSSSTDFSGVCGARSAVFCVVFCRSLFVPLSFFLLTIVLPVLLRFVDSDYPFGIFKLFLHLKMTFRLLVFFSKGIQCIQFDWTMNNCTTFVFTANCLMLYGNSITDA